MFKKMFILFLSALPLFGAVERSVIPHLDQPPAFEENQINQNQKWAMSCGYGIPLRVMSFNMLFDKYDHNLDPENRWPVRRERLVEYLRYAHPDLIGSQELECHQTAYLMEQLGDDYGFVGEEVIIYNKKRLRLIEAIVCEREFTVAEFEELRSGAHFTLINVHLRFDNVEGRLVQAQGLQALIKCTEGPVLVTGDMNTFPMRPELPLPFYDGDHVLSVIEEGGVRDARLLAIKGHYGLISSTNFDTERMQPFVNDGEPGVVLDHIFVSPEICVKTHAIDPARVDGLFTSDHFPVIADVVISQ